IDIRAYLHHSPAYKYWEEVPGDGFHMLCAQSEFPLQRTEKSHHCWQLHRKLQATADDACDCEHHRQSRLGYVSTFPKEGRNLGNVPDHWCSVGKEELAVAVQDAEAPCRNNQQRRSGKEDLHQADGELALLPMKARRNGVDQPGSRKHSNECQQRSNEEKDREDRF